MRVYIPIQMTNTILWRLTMSKYFKLTESNIPVDFTEDQFNNLFHFINVNKHRNKYLIEILNVLKKSKEVKND